MYYFSTRVPYYNYHSVYDASILSVYFCVCLVPCSTSCLWFRLFNCKLDRALLVVPSGSLANKKKSSTKESPSNRCVHVLHLDSYEIPPAHHRRQLDIVSGGVTELYLTTNAWAYHISGRFTYPDIDSGAFRTIFLTIKFCTFQSCNIYV